MPGSQGANWDLTLVEEIARVNGTRIKADRGAVAQISWRGGRERGLGLALQIADFADQRAKGACACVSCLVSRVSCRVRVWGVGCVGWCFVDAVMKFTA
jgi:hypothetical protein